MLNYGVLSWFYGEITEFTRQTVVRKHLLLGQCCDSLFAIMYAPVSDISYIAESVASMLVCLLYSIDG